MERHFTSTCYVVKEEKTLLIMHPKFKKWLPPGGHVEEGETPLEAALREVEEESGLIVKILSQENLWIEEENATSFKRPYLCLLEKIPAYKQTPAHEHMDMIYVGRPIGGALTDGKWFTLGEVETLDMFPDGKQIIRQILNQMPSYI